MGTVMGSIHVEEAADVLRDLLDSDGPKSPQIRNVAFRLPGRKTGKRDFITHWLHRYPAKMFHRIPRIILEEISERGRLRVLDPFCGSGTVLLESILLGHHAIGIDVNPMARLIARVKTTSIAPEHLRRHLRSIRNRAERIDIAVEKDKVLDFWFKPEVRAELHALMRSVQSIGHAECREFFSLCVSSCVRPCSWADPAIAPPVRLKEERVRVAGKRYEAHFTRANELRPIDVFNAFERVTSENIARMGQLFAREALGQAEVLGEKFHASATGLDAASIDLVLTSPPYCGAQKYVRSLRLEMLMLGLSSEAIAEADRRTLGTERVSSTSCANWKDFSDVKLSRLIRLIHDRNPLRAYMLAEYIKYLQGFAIELSRVLRPGGNAFVTFGTDLISGIRVDLAELFAEMAEQCSLHHVATLVDTIPSRGMITVRHSSASTIADEQVVWLRRE